MRQLFGSIICIILFWNCANNCNQNAAIEEHNKEKFDSFLTQFAQFDGNQPKESFFRQRNQFPNERLSPVLDKYHFSFLLPYDEECNCETKELYYTPCYKIERKNYYLISMHTCCDVTKTAWYPYEDNTLVTYDKKGKIIDFATVGTGSDLEYYKIDTPSEENEIVYTQYYFKDIESFDEGNCDTYVYKVTVDDNGKIDKRLLREEKNVKVTL